MSLKSIDMVTMVPRLTDVSKVQQVKDQEGQVAQQQFAAQLQAKVTHEQHQVNLPPEAAKTEEKREGARRGRQGGGQGRAKKGSAAPEPANAKGAADGKGSVIDIILGG